MEKCTVTYSIELKCDQTAADRMFCALMDAVEENKEWEMGGGSHTEGLTVTIVNTGQDKMTALHTMMNRMNWFVEFVYLIVCATNYTSLSVTASIDPEGED